MSCAWDLLCMGCGFLMVLVDVCCVRVVHGVGLCCTCVVGGCCECAVHELWVRYVN